MADQTLKILNTRKEDLRLIRKQFNALQAKEEEVNEKLAKLNKSLEQAQNDYETCMRSNLVGNSSDQELKEAKSKVKELTDSIQDANQTLKIIAESKVNLNSELGGIPLEIKGYRGDVCFKISREFIDEVVKDKKLYSKLMSGYAAFHASNDYDRSWTRFLLLSFEPPSESDLNIALEKFKMNNEFMRD